MSQEKVAEVVSCDPRTIQRYEAGEQFPTQEALLKMKSCYGCEFSDLFPEELL